jgi:hypothetical protein
VWQPDELVAHDLHKLDGVDYRHLPHPDCSFAQAVYDPPYIAMGGRDTTGLPGFLERYGLHGCPQTPAALQRHNDAGLAELRRVLEPRAMLVAKTADYVSGGKLWLGVHRTVEAAEALGFRLEDKLLHVGEPRPQPDGRGHVHARGNCSTALVLRVDGRPRRRLH